MHCAELINVYALPMTAFEWSRALHEPFKMRENALMRNLLTGRRMRCLILRDSERESKKETIQSRVKADSNERVV